jgi:hypothetical protein
MKANTATYGIVGCSTLEQFVSRFEDCGRGKQFSDAVFETLFNYYSGVANGQRKNIELECDAICNAWTEYDKKGLMKAFKKYGKTLSEILWELYDHTTVLGTGENRHISDSYVVKNF